MISLKWNPKGWLFIIGGLILIPVFSYMCEGNFVPDLKYTFTNNRYLAHSVRELITFPVTYFPLFFLVFYDIDKIELPLHLKSPDKIKKVVLFSLIIFLALLIYQIILPLKEGIDNLSQKPDFTKGHSLPLLYLITSHYFEHFLDTLFFVLFSGWLLTLFLTNEKK